MVLKIVTATVSCYLEKAKSMANLQLIRLGEYTSSHNAQAFYQTRVHSSGGNSFTAEVSPLGIIPYFASAG
jgi:hypothetical protein